MVEEQGAADSFPAVRARVASLFRRVLQTGRRLLSPREVAFLAIFALYLDRWVNMRLVFWNQNDLFLVNLGFARDFMVAAGQPCQWLGKLLLQACHGGWPGALAVAAVAGLLFLSAKASLWRIAPGARVDHVWIVPAVLLVLLHSQYTYSLSTTLGLAIALVGTSAYVRAPGRNGWARLAAFVAASVPVYYLAGGAYLVFVTCSLVYELVTVKRRLRGLSLVPAALAVKLGIDSGLGALNAAYLHCELPETSYLIHNTAGAWAVGLLDAYFPVCALFLAARGTTAPLLARLRRARLWPRTRTAELGAGRSRQDRSKPWGRRRGSGVAGQSAGRGPRAWSTRMRPIWPWALTALFVVVAAGAGMKALGTGDTRKILEIDFASRRHEWEKVLHEAADLPPALYADCGNQDVDEALYHLGRLPYDMFAYPQRRLIVDHQHGARGRLLSRKAFDLLLELGRVNEAETIAHNDLELHPSAEFLMRLALV